MTFSMQTFYMTLVTGFIGAASFIYMLLNGFPHPVWVIQVATPLYIACASFISWRAFKRRNS